MGPWEWLDVEHSLNPCCIIVKWTFRTNVTEMGTEHKLISNNEQKNAFKMSPAKCGLFGIDKMAESHEMKKKKQEHANAISPLNCWINYTFLFYIVIDTTK